MFYIVWVFFLVHFYSYLVDPWNWKIYPQPRFSSEYGYQSWESIETLRNYSEPSDLSYFGKFANHRQHHPLGQIEMLYEVAKQFKLPSPVYGEAAFPGLIYLTQVRLHAHVRNFWKQKRLVFSCGVVPQRKVVVFMVYPVRRMTIADKSGDGFEN